MRIGERKDSTEAVVGSQAIIEESFQNSSKYGNSTSRNSQDESFRKPDRRGNQAREYYKGGLHVLW